jgi:hypothetical protein
MMFKDQQLLVDVADSIFEASLEAGWGGLDEISRDQMRTIAVAAIAAVRCHDAAKAVHCHDAAKAVHIPISDLDDHRDLPLSLTELLKCRGGLTEG